MENQNPNANAVSCGDGSCAGGDGPALVYALGQLSYDYGSEARLDSFVQQGLSNPHHPLAVLEYLEERPGHAAALTWTLVQDTTPVYAIHPMGAFAAETYATLREFLASQLNEQGVERVSLPGWTKGSTTLMNGHTVPNLVPEQRGMYSWSTSALVEAVIGEAPKAKAEKAAYAEKARDVANFLQRIYHEIRNLGASPQERAVNYAATNAFQINDVYQQALKDSMKLDSIDVERSPICRPESDCWDVKLTFFNPAKRQEQARVVYRFTVDVSDIVPVTVGEVRSWDIY
jgi:cyanobactin maturation PatA/PatG family protease